MGIIFQVVAFKKNNSKFWQKGRKSKPIFTMTDRFNVNISLSKNWEHLQNRFVGTGHPDITKFEWGVNMQRDSIASYLGHADLMSYFAVAENESSERIRLNLLEKMLQPCGPPPKKFDEDDEMET